MKPSPFQSIIQKQGNKVIKWGYALLAIIAAMLISMLVFIEIDGVSLGLKIWENLF